MAKVTLQGDISIIGKAVYLTEVYVLEWKDKDGNLKSIPDAIRKWNLWFPSGHPLSNGDWVEVTGKGSWKVIDWENEEKGTSGKGVGYSLNDIQIEAHQRNKSMQDLDDAAKYGDAPF
jgi:hypothetical protein